MRAHWLVGLVAVIGCNKDAAAPGVKPPAAPSLSEQDALWQLAPDGATFGIVASPRGLAMIERGALAIDAMLAGAPELAPAHRKILSAWTHATGASTLGLAGLGLSASQGFALFGSDADQDVMVVPVVDRNRFVTWLHGRRDGDADVFDQEPLKGAVCKPLRGRYVCADKPALWDKLGRGNFAALRARAGARGDLEVVAGGLADSPTLSLAAVVQLEPGAVVVRGTLGGVPAVASMLGNPIRPRDGAATAAGFGVIDVSPYLAALPPVPLVHGVTAAQLARSLAGPIDLAVPPGSRDLASIDLAMRVPLNDPAPAKAVVEHCADIAALEPLGAHVEAGACRMNVPNLNAEIDAWVDGNELRIGRRVAGTPAPIEPSPLASELAQGAWSAAVFGRGSYLALASLPVMTAVFAQLPPEMGLAPRLLPLFNEFGAGVRKDGDALHFVLGFRTLWANPAAVVDKVLAISQAQMESGQATGMATAIAASAPRSPFAQDLGAGTGGMVAIMVPLGVVVGIAGPSFMDYMKRSKQAGATPAAH